MAKGKIGSKQLLLLGEARQTQPCPNLQDLPGDPLIPLARLKIKWKNNFTETRFFYHQFNTQNFKLLAKMCPGLISFQDFWVIDTCGRKQSKC